MSIGRGQLLNLIEIFLDPLVLVLSLWIVELSINGHLPPHEVVLSLVVFSLTFPSPARMSYPPWRVIRYIVFEWLTLFAILLFFGYASGYLSHFDPDVLAIWFGVAPASQIGMHFLLRLSAPAILKLQGGTAKAIVVGMNDQGVELAQRLAADPYSNIDVVGFFDDRGGERLVDGERNTLLGTIPDVPRMVKNRQIDLIYLSLPMTSQQRILSLLSELRDTTASVYFVPDTFVSDIIQARMDVVCGVPVVAVCESPFSGMGGMIKGASDVVLSLLILALISPLLLVIALCVKLSSPGPVIFRQRRYGLDGNEITIYKFRTMTVCEDGDSIVQAREGDQRVTPLGAFLRRTSLDELPQFINVLQGRMSIVGPRPHAIAHNEMYRKLIEGYMVRHKVKPGITGWAQVNGCRGETETLDKMKRRIEYDLDYLRNWSLRLDLHIIAKTVWVILKGDGAY